MNATKFNNIETQFFTSFFNKDIKSGYFGRFKIGDQKVQ